METGHFVRALGKWEEALLIDPHNGVLHELRAQVLMEMGEYEPALDAAKQSVELAPDWSDAHFTLGRVYFNLGSLEEAHICMSQALQLALQNVDEEGRPTGGAVAPSEIEDELDEVMHLLELKQQMQDSQQAPEPMQMDEPPQEPSIE